MAKKKKHYKRSAFDKVINVICYVLLVYFSINEFSHLYRELDTIKKAPDLYERHYTFNSTFPFVGSYFLMKPEGYNPKYKYPLVIALHGVSKHAYAAEQLATPKFRKRYTFFVMVPIAPVRAFWLSPKDKAYRMPQNIPYPDHFPHVITAIKNVRAAFQIDENKIILTGHSMGASAVIGGMNKYPELFSVGIASSGAWSPNEIGNIQRPLFVYHGTNDAAVPVSFSAQLKNVAIKQRKPISVEFLNGQGHGIGPLVYGSQRVWDDALKVVR